MKVACPHCGTQYSLTAKQIGPAGRTLQCAKCKHRWFVAPAEGTPQSLAGNTDEAPPLPPSSVPGLDELASIGTGPRWWRQVRMGWAPELTLAVAGIGVAALAVVGFDWLLAYTPPENTTPATHQPGPQPSGLVLSELSREVTQRGGNTLLIIHGTLTNATGGTASLPDLRVQLLDHEGVELDYWPVSYTSSTLAPAQSTAWQVTFVNPPLARVAAYRAFFANGPRAAAVATPTGEAPANTSLDSTAAGE